MAGDKAKSGRDGWLLIFILLMGVAAPIYYAVEFNMLLNDTSYRMRVGYLPPSAGTIIITLAALLTIASIVPLIWSAVRMWRDHR